MSALFCLRSRLIAPFFALFFALPHSLFSLDAAVLYSVYSNGEQPYLEVNFEIAGKTIMWRAVDSLNMNASVEVLILARRGDAVLNYEKYILNSPAVPNITSLLDGKRIAVGQGSCVLEVSFKDMFDTTNIRQFQYNIEVDVEKSPYLSEIQLLRGFKADDSDHYFTKSGFFMEPLPFLFYDKTTSTLAFYCEIYNTKKVIKEPKYLVRYFIEQQLGNDRSNLAAIGSQRRVPTDIDGVLMQMDISELESGNYTLTVEIRTANSEKLAERKVEFQRSNPYLRIKAADVNAESIQHQFVEDLKKEELVYMMRALRPIVQYTEAETMKNIIQAGEEQPMRFFIFNHFVMQHPNDPKAAYQRYLDVAKAVDNTYKSGFGHGFETDRGITFLRYGKPDDVIRVEDEPSAPPYEIWIYYALGRTSQRNAKFLFYNPSLAAGDFVMLHSTARGERNNPRWEVDLYRRNAPTEHEGSDYHDATHMQPNNNRQARRYFENF